MKNKKPIIALGALAVVGLVAGTIAYFTSEAQFDNEFTTATYKTESVETFTSPDNWAPGQEVPKTVVTENKGSIPVAVRTTLSESWKDENGDPIDQPTINQVIGYIPASATDRTHIAIINLDNTTDWEYKDGYYYYKTALGAKASDAATGPKTNSFIKSVTLNPDLATDSSCTPPGTGSTRTITCTTTIKGLGKATYTLTVRVETVQFDQYKAVWFPNAAAADIVNITPAS